MEFKLFKPGLDDICGPTHLLSHDFLNHSISFSRKNGEFVDEQPTKVAENLLSYWSISFKNCQKLCAEYDEKTCTGFLYVPHKNETIKVSIIYS